LQEAPAALKAGAVAPAGAREAISNLVHDYAEKLDDGELEAVAGLFRRATYKAAGGDIRRGQAEVLAALRRRVRLHDGLPRTKHVITNLTVEVDEAAGAASARSYFTVLQATSRLRLQPILAGRYHDRFACTDGEWHFTARVIHLDLRGELSEHLIP
jgi:3-phenylpropionate/cinnamic acid dioxygenase small subunit